ncbi:hypothetical protein WS68_00230 [Burkholderia sp. TSV86]|nr:hypothetical protein WS68_00230 [Burkholderia sp. TSV86]
MFLIDSDSPSPERALSQLRLSAGSSSKTRAAYAQRERGGISQARAFFHARAAGDLPGFE